MNQDLIAGSIKSRLTLLLNSALSFFEKNSSTDRSPSLLKGGFMTPSTSLLSERDCPAVQYVFRISEMNDRCILSSSEYPISLSIVDDVSSSNSYANVGSFSN